MTAELLVNVTPSETRVAYIDGGILQEIHIEREARRGIVGNIYKGRVSRVLPGMQAAFVDKLRIRPHFCTRVDIMPHTGMRCREEQKQFTVRTYFRTGSSGPGPDGSGGERSARHQRRPPDDGHYAAFPLSVFMPGLLTSACHSVSSEAERERLKKVVADYCDEQGGFIIRTAAEGCMNRS